MFYKAHAKQKQSKFYGFNWYIGAGETRRASRAIRTLITDRYYRSLDLLYRAASIAYQAFFFDNSGASTRLVAHFKRTEAGQQWDPVIPRDLTEWFKKYYVNMARKAGDVLPPEMDN